MNILDNSSNIHNTPEVVCKKVEKSFNKSQIRLTISYDIMMLLFAAAYYEI